MPIEHTKLEDIANDYVAAMTSIRGRRVHRLLMRAFSDSECVLKASTEMGNTALVAIKEGGAIAICQTDGTGETAPIMDFAHPSSIAITTSFDLKKDSLPIVTWSLWHPVLARATGTLTVSTAGLSTPEIGHVAELLKSVAR